jgi:hypothetical protein
MNEIGVKPSCFRAVIFNPLPHKTLMGTLISNYLPFLLAAVWCPIGYCLAATGVLSPFLQASLVLTIMLSLKASAIPTMLMCWAVYCTGLMGTTRLQAQGVDTGYSALLSGEELKSTEIDPHASLIYRVVMMIVFLVLPIGVAPGTLTGWPVFAGVALLYCSNQFEQDSKDSVLHPVVWHLIEVGVIMAISYLSRSAVSSPLPLISAVVLPACVLKSRIILEPENDAETLPSPMIVAVGAYISWVTPGISHIPIAVILPQGIHRLVTIGMVEAATEAWGFQLLLRGYSAQKTPLQDLLTQQFGNQTLSVSLAGSFQYPAWTLGAAILITIVAAVMTYQLQSLEIKPLKTGIVFCLTAQAFALAGLWAIPLIAIGFGLHIGRESLAPTCQDSRALAFLAPMMI